MFFVLIIFLFIFFIGLIFVFRYLLTKNISSATTHLDGLTKEYAKKEEKVKEELQKAQESRQKMLQSAQEEAGRIKTKIIQEAQAEKERIVSKAAQESKTIVAQAEKTRKYLIEEEEEKISEAAVKKAVELIGGILPSEVCKNLHDYWLGKLIEEGLQQLKNLNIPEEDEVKIISAFPLEDSQRKNLLSVLKDKLEKDIELKEETNSEIIAGLIISVGNLIFDGSLRDKVQEVVSGG